MTYEDLYDRRKAAALLGAQAPWWEPGTASGYHAISQGYLEGEIVQRVTGRSLGEFVRDNITGPLGADFHIGTPASADSRVAHVIPPGPMVLPDDLDPTSVLAKTFGNPVMDATKSWDIDWRRAEIPAAGGHGNARSVAQIHTPMACGGEANGVRLLGKETIEAVFDEQCNGVDLVLGVPLRHGIGFGLPVEGMPLGPNERTCFWGGWGGSLAILDLDARMSFSYVMNKMGEGTVGDMRGALLLMAAYASLAQS
jgi:CubicO group peptidase (beta-lactamase class C family)